MWQLLTVFPQNMAKFCKRNSEKKSLVRYAAHFILFIVSK